MVPDPPTGQHCWPRFPHVLDTQVPLKHIVPEPQVPPGPPQHAWLSEPQSVQTVPIHCMLLPQIEYDGDATFMQAPLVELH